MPHKLLLADDSVTIQRVIELTFADEDVQVVAVGDGDQAIARVESDPPDIVLADVGMPLKDGYEVASHIKKSARLSHIPVLLLTGAFEPVDQARADAIGCDGVLAKPFEPQQVIGRVKELLARPRPAAVAAAPNAKLSQLDGYFDRLDEAFASLSMGRTATAAPPPDLPLTYASPQPHVDAPAAAMPPPAPLAAAAPRPAAAPATVAPPAPAPVLSKDELVDQVTRRVLEQLSDRVVRETVSEIVTSVAERLVREEIERIKDSMK